MEKSSKVFRAGARKSRLSVLQTEHALQLMGRLLPAVRFERVGIDTPGDRDRSTDLRESPPDFFTRDLDEAVLGGKVDCAIHSAKDLPETLREGIDFVWLPWVEDARDVLVFRPGQGRNDLPAKPRVGVSSQRRADYALSQWADARLDPLRGNIEERIRQLDEGNFDVLIMAGAALIRLGLESRINEWIRLAELSVPAGQGSLAMTFRAGDPVFLRLRSLMVKTVRFAGSGIGRMGTLTMESQAALRDADVCLHDELLPQEVLAHLSKDAECINVGKRIGVHSHKQEDISQFIALHAKRGKRVVRLKGGDPTLFGRLAEEVDVLEGYHLPYQVLPGVSSFSVTAADTGMLLTRRGVSRGVTLITPRTEGGGTGPIGAATRRDLPVVFYMATRCLKEVADELMAEGRPATQPATVVFNAGAKDSIIVRGTLGDIHAAVEKRPPVPTPGLLVVGEAAGFSFTKEHGALQGQRVLLTCSEALEERAARAVVDFGGMPVPCVLFSITPEPDLPTLVGDVADYDWVVLTSPSSVRVFLDALARAEVCVREIPAIAVTGVGTANELRTHGIVADLVPEHEFSAEALVAAMRDVGPERGRKVLRLRSEKAGESLAQALSDAGYAVTDRVLYRNQPVTIESEPAFDAVLFASASAVEQFEAQIGRAALAAKAIVAIGRPTAKALAGLGVDKPLIPPEATVDSAIFTLAADVVNRSLEHVVHT